VTAFCKNRQDRVQIHVKTRFARQAVQVKEIDAAARDIIQTIPPRISRHHVSPTDLQIFGKKQSRRFAAQATDCHLPRLVHEVLQLNPFVDVLDVLVSSLRNVNEGEPILAVSGKEVSRRNTAESRRRMVTNNIFCS
jgi:hypothetical protein